MLADSTLLPSGRNYVCWQSQSKGRKSTGDLQLVCPALDGRLPATALPGRMARRPVIPAHLIISSMRTPSLCSLTVNLPGASSCADLMCRCMASGSICGGSTQMPSSHPTTSLQACSEALHSIPRSRSSPASRFKSMRKCTPDLLTMSYRQCVC